MSPLNAPAFPHYFIPESYGDCSGMTLRQYAAIKAMQGLMFNATKYATIDDQANDALKAADILLQLEQETRK